MIYSIAQLRLVVTSGSSETRALLNKGQLVELTPKALRMLEVFASRPHQTLTRDDLRAAIWPGEFVEDGNVTRHVSLVRTCLRQQLGEGDHLITLSKQGYRLNVPVTVEDENEVVPVVQSAPPPDWIEPAIATPTPSRPSIGTSKKQFPIYGLVAVCLIVLIGLSGLLHWHHTPVEATASNQSEAALQDLSPATALPPALHPTPLNRTRPALAILDLANNSSGTSWDWLGTAMREVLWMDFNANEDIKVVNGQNTIDSEVDLGLPRKIYDAALIRQIGKRMNADYAIVGTYRVDDKQIHVEMELMQTRDRASLDSFSLDATEQTLIPELAKAVSQFRAKLDLPDAATAAANVLPLEHGFTGLKPFAEGVRLQRLGFPAQAHPPLLLAAKLNPLSPMAHLELSRNSGKIGMPDLAASEAHFAIQRSNALPEETKLYVRARVEYYAAQYTECAEDYRRLVRLRPDDREYKLYLGECYFSNSQADQELKLLAPYYRLHDPRIDRQMARDAQRSHDWNQMLEYSDAQVHDASTIYATAMTANGMVTRARAKVQLGDMQGAVVDFKEAISIAERKQLLWELARAYELLGDAQSKLNNPTEMLVNYKKMLGIWQRLGEKRNVLFSMEQVASAQQTLHDYDAAHKTLLDALQYSDAIQNEGYMSEVHLNLAELSMEQHDLKAATSYAQLAFHEAMATGELYIAGAAEGDLGDIALSQGDIITARGNFSQGLDLAKQAKEADLQARMLKRLVKLETSAGNTDAAGRWQSQIATNHP